jgi:hypothetical protein
MDDPHEIYDDCIALCGNFWCDWESDSDTKLQDAVAHSKATGHKTLHPLWFLGIEREPDEVRLLPDHKWPGE